VKGGEGGESSRQPTVLTVFSFFYYLPLLRHRPLSLLNLFLSPFPSTPFGLSRKIRICYTSGSSRATHIQPSNLPHLLTQHTAPNPITPETLTKQYLTCVLSPALRFPRLPARSPPHALHARLRRQADHTNPTNTTKVKNGWYFCLHTRPDMPTPRHGTAQSMSRPRQVKATLVERVSACVGAGFNH